LAGQLCFVYELQSKATKLKNENWECIKLESWTREETINRMKRQTTKWEKYSKTKHVIRDNIQNMLETQTTEYFESKNTANKYKQTKSSMKKMHTLSD
jgi:hypothetical protein